MATATYMNAIQSAAAGSAGQPITHLAIRTTLTGAGRIIATKQFTTPLGALQVGQHYAIAANLIVITQSGGDATPDGNEWSLEQDFANDVYMSLHTGDPGNTGANEAAIPATRITLSGGIANWTFSE